MVIPTPTMTSSANNTNNPLKKESAESFAVHVKEEEMVAGSKSKEKKGGNGDGGEKSPAGRRTPRSPVECR